MTVAIWYKKNNKRAIAVSIKTALTIPCDSSFEVIFFLLAKIKKTRQ